MKIAKHKPLEYDFYHHGVTQSLIDMWLTCPKQAQLYVEGWTLKKTPSQAIIFGNTCHHVCEKAYSGISCPLPGNIKSYITEYEERLNIDEMIADDAYETEISLAKAEAVMKAYFKHYASDFENNWEIAETIFKIPYTFPDGKVTHISGKLDGGFVSETGLWVMDHKFMGRINIENLLVLLPVDIQVNTYLYCVSKLFQTPKGFKYNVVRNPSSKPHQRKQETLKEYADRIEADITDRPKHYFNRINIPVTQAEIDKWEQEWLAPMLKDMRRWYDSKFKWPAYYRPNNLKTEYGTLSPWAYALADNDFSRYEKRKHIFPELVE